MATSLDRTYLGTGWKFPVRVNPSGSLSWSEGEQSVQESIWIILSTAMGERQMLPSFGCGMQDMVFAPNNSTTQTNIQHMVKQALAQGEARIDVLDVTVSAAPDEANMLLIRVDYRIRANNAMNNMVFPFYVTEGTGG
ncbi:MAG: GPW/gp25 family protein [Terracidiphilus sp.]|jgi:phage baseplate assembly protein W